MPGSHSLNSELATLPSAELKTNDQAPDLTRLTPLKGMAQGGSKNRCS